MASNEREQAMSPMSTGVRRGVVATFAAVMITTAACGTEQDTTGDDAVRAPAAIPQAPPFHTSPDVIERRKGWGEETPTSPDAAERRGQEAFVVPYAGRRIPD
jgi:hypothetical protein